MAGSFVSIDLLGEEAITKVLNRILSRGLDLTPAFYEMGEHLLESTQDRMSREESPDGTPYEPLSINTLEQKDLTNQSDKILRGYGTLADTLSYQVSGDQLMFGSNMEYAATHQFGRDSANIPARPFLGVNHEDEIELIDILRSHLSGA
jgi:phage virion morphogenesis protein